MRVIRRFVPGALPCLLACALFSVAPAEAQIRPTAIRGATIFTGEGPPIEDATIQFSSGKISELARKVDVGLLAKKIDGKGKFLTPGFIDVYGDVALRTTSAAGRPTARAYDAFDRFARDEMREALAQGVTFAFLPAHTGAGFGGVGAVVKLAAGLPEDEVLVRDNVAMCASVGGGRGVSPVARVTSVVALRRAFQEAKDYRKAIEDYEEELKEYEKKVAERAEKQAKEAPADGKPADGKKDEKGKPGGGPPRGRPDAPKAEQPKPPEPPPGGEAKPAEKKEELKKPVEQPKDRNKEALLKVIDGEMPLRIEAHRPQDILNCVDLAEQFGLSLIIEGATGAPLVADRLAERKVRVVLGLSSGVLLYDAGPQRFAAAAGAAQLEKAGVEVYLGSGPVTQETPAPRLALGLARCIGEGLSPDAALERLTSRAARLLGIEKKAGTLAPGMPADFVVWSGHPLSPGAHVEMVYLGGREVYDIASQDAGADDDDADGEE